MGELQGKNIILGITGSIAAYKAAALTRLLIKEGACVKVVMTTMAKEFISPLTMATLSKSPIMVDFYNPENGDWNSHVDLGLWADLYLIAPATANTIGKMASGVADNLLLTTYFSAKCPVMVAPAMDLDMYRHPATLQNIRQLVNYGDIIIEPESGELASGLIGKGRMEEPENIVSFIKRYFTTKDFAGKRVLITAGPTYEKIDPVRFIGNYSSGKMGFAIADEFAKRGADVVLVHGAVSITTENSSIEKIEVESAAEMYKMAIDNFPSCDIAVMAAAVADFTPEHVAAEKIKKREGDMAIQLRATKDIAAELGKIKEERQMLVGFALETENELDNAREKLTKKNMDIIVLNTLRDEGAGFRTDTNKVTILDRWGERREYLLKSKTEVAKDILDFIFEKMK